MWDQPYMADADRTPLQTALSDAIARSDRTREHFDTQLRQKLGTTGKPLWDVERGKVRRPSPKILRAMEEVLGFKPEHLVDLVHPRDAAPTDIVRAPEQPLIRSADAGDTVEILLLDLSLSMGPGTLIEDFVESELVSFDASVLKRITRTPSDRLRFVTGIGTSHEPKFQNGDQFLIDINDRHLTRLDGYYWITFDGAHALKRLRPLGGGMIQIISENPDYAPMDVERNAVRIEGRAVWFARGL